MCVCSCRVIVMMCVFLWFFFFKQKTAYEMRISDWSSDVCSSDLTSAPLLQGDALRLPLVESSVDGVTCGFALRNFAALPPFFEELGRVVRPGGRIALLEVAEPPSRVLRFGHGIYFGKVVPLVGGLLSDPSAYRYLPRSVAYLPDPGEMLGQLPAAGFVDVERRLLSVGIATLITATPQAPAPAHGSGDPQAGRKPCGSG